MSFAGIPIRANAQKILRGWFNDLRTAGLALETLVNSFLGAGNLGETSFTVANNQVAAANVTGLAFAGGATVRSFFVDYEIYRNTTSTGATELSESGLLIGTYKPVAGTWEMVQAPVAGDAGVTLSITSGGQIQYTSTSITGTPASSFMKFKARTMGS